MSNRKPHAFQLTFFNALLVIGSQGVAVAAPGAFSVDPARSKVVVRLFKDGLAARFAHDHVVAARELRGSISGFDERKLSSTKLEIVVDARSLDADPPALRRAYRLKGTLSDKDRREVNKNLRADDQLAVTKYPKIHFRSTAVSGGLKSKRGGIWLEIKGRLTLRGKTRQVSTRVRVWRAGKRLKGSGQLKLRQSDFGYKPYRAMAGLVKVKDRAVIDIYLEASPR